MSIEIRNITPADEADNVPIYSNAEFDVVALDDYTIDVSTLTVDIETTSNIDDETHTISYAYGDTQISSYGVDYDFHHITVNPSIPFDESLDVTIKINVDGEDQYGDTASMDEYEITFSTIDNGVVSIFKSIFIDQAQRIPVYNEILKKDSTTSPQVFDSAFQKWNPSPNPRVQVNQLLVATNDEIYPYTIDSENGKVLFTSALEFNDQVDATYVFSFFSDEQIVNFFDQATAVWTMHPPYGGPNSLFSANGVYQRVLMVGASLFAFREILFSMAFQEPRLVFDNASGGEGWTQIKDLFTALYEAYSKDWENLLEAKKVKLPSIASVVTPSYTLPGGRSRMFRYLYKT